MRTIEISENAYLTICGLVQQTDQVDPERVAAREEVWKEIRAEFPLADFPIDNPMHYVEEEN